MKITSRNKKLVVFDFDGTLVDSMSGFADVASGVMARLFKVDAAWARERYCTTSGLPFPLQLEVIFPGHVLNAQAVRDYDQGREDSYSRALLFPDVVPALAALRSKGIQLAVSSNNYQASLHRKLGEHHSLFDTVLGFTPGFLKGPSHFGRLEADLGIPVAQMLFVGDSLHDGFMAKKCGVDFVARTGTFTRTQFEAQGLAIQITDSLHSLNDLTEDVSLTAPLSSPLTSPDLRIRS